MHLGYSKEDQAAELTFFDGEDGMTILLDKAGVEKIILQAKDVLIELEKAGKH